MVSCGLVVHRLMVRYNWVASSKMMSIMWSWSVK